MISKVEINCHITQYGIIVSILAICMNIKKNTILKNRISKDFKLFTTIKKRIIDNLFNYPGGAGQVRAKSSHVGITPGTQQSLVHGGAIIQL